MPLAIETFTNKDLSGGWTPNTQANGEVLFKALGHPLSNAKHKDLIKKLQRAGRVALYDPNNIVTNVQAYYDLSDLPLVGYFVQRLEDVGQKAFGKHKARALTQLPQAKPDMVFALSYEPSSLTPLARAFAGAQLCSLAEARLPDTMLSNPHHYLDSLNFAINFAFFRDSKALNQHTRLTTANYWSARGARSAHLLCYLFGDKGQKLKQWEMALPPANAPIIIDSQVIRKTYRLGDFTGSLFLHVIGAKGHDIIKYTLDYYGNPNQLSCSHDANAWPADYYAGLPASSSHETLLLYAQNAHPIPIPAHAIGLRRLGHNEVVTYPKIVAPFATQAINVNKLLPQARYPNQIEIIAGRYLVRPRYEVVRQYQGQARHRIAHANVERIDLKPDKSLRRLPKQMGRGYIMPLPILPLQTFATEIMPTPMARTQKSLPVRVELFHPSGVLAAKKFLGNIARRKSLSIAVDDWLAQAKLSLQGGYGHVEFLYDFREGGDGDGWLHALARFEQRQSGHRAETIFGAHIFNTPIIYKDEPQSYINQPPGLSTRLFLRLAPPQSGLRTLCHLIYPASLPWHEHSDTQLLLYNDKGKLIAKHRLRIACCGSQFFEAEQIFAKPLATSKRTHYIIVRDTSCRLFGFQGLRLDNTSFCLDHMFGF